MSDMAEDDRKEAIARFVPWDHHGPLPSDPELERRLVLARAVDAQEAAEMLEEIDLADPVKLLQRLRNLEARLIILEKTVRTI
jgi:hypothetical protein